MSKLTGAQRKFLRSQAHHYNPVIMIGKSGLTPALIKATQEVLESHELIKVKFIDFKDTKNEITDKLCRETDSEIVGRIGNIAILFKQNDDKDKRIIRLQNK
ncbi:MAG: ribosome assembly RNA-binding protein YhbY [Spirochaetes bacterium]|nr:ribosome assembly RNA-binding protein YhbY [Spirochaetota bacterium]